MVDQTEASLIVMLCKVNGPSVLRTPDVYPGSRFFSTPDPGSLGCFLGCRVSARLAQITTTLYDFVVVSKNLMVRIQARKQL